MCYNMKICVTDTVKVQQLVVVFRNLKLFATDVVLRCSEHGMHIQTLDNAHCCLLDAHMSADWFDTYEYTSDTDETKIGINTVVLQKVMDVMNPTQSLEIVLDSTQDNAQISMLHSQETCDKVFHVPLVNVETEVMNPSDNDYDADIVMKTKMFTTLIKQLQGFSDVLHVNLTNDTICLNATGDEGKMVANINIENDVMEYAITEDTVIDQQFGLKYIEYMYAFGGLSCDIHMHFNENQPFHARYPLSDNDEHNYVSFYLAPRIDE